MAYTQIQLDALRSAISEGTLSVQYADKSVRYRSLDEMERIERKMEREINAVQPTTNTIGIRSRKGL